ncbi:MAG: SPOR domain-containing protein [Bacteroidales bacterium]|nr:SPOR domain-containing protein [Bacteroidales bacterium]
MDIVQHISELLFDHDCVIVHGFGGFVANYQSAKIHPVQHTFSPPAKIILFNKDLRNNDGLLANKLVSSEKISYEKALEEIDAFAMISLRTINNGETIDLDGIGKLYPDKEGNIQFEQSSKVNFLKDTYGMSSFVSPAIKRNYNLSRHQVRPNLADRQKSPDRKNNSVLLLRIAATVTILFIFSVAGYNYFSPADSEINESGILSSKDYYKSNDVAVNASLIPELNETENTDAALSGNTDNSIAPLEISNDEPKIGNEESEVYDLSTISQSGNPDYSGVAKSLLPEASDIEENREETEVIPAETTALSQSAPGEIQPAKKMYHLIAGSFQKPENATSLIDAFRQKGYEPSVIGPAENGFYRVSISAYIRKSDALAELRKVRETLNPNIWLLRN